MKNSGPVGLVTLVCLTCGNEHFYDQSVPSSVKCEKCGGTVFRQFATPTEPDDATLASLEEQARSVSYGDPSPDSTRGKPDANDAHGGNLGDRVFQRGVMHRFGEREQHLFAGQRKVARSTAFVRRISRGRCTRAGRCQTASRR